MPHVLFRNSQVPWLFTVAPSDPTTPWLGLLVFTPDELALTSDQDKAIKATLGKDNIDWTPTCASSLLVSDVAKLSDVAYQPIPIAAAADPTPVKVIFLQSSLYSNLFGMYQNGKVRVDPGNNMDLSRYKYMSHVRKFNADEMANLGGNGESTFSASVSPRTGPTTISTPTTMHAHLISLEGLSSDSMKTSQSDLKPYALVSLYSWTFTSLPPSSFAVGEAFTRLGQNLQPLRKSDALLSQISQKIGNPLPADKWVKTRMLAGYTLIKHRVQTGEPTIALQRGILTPIKFDPLDFPPSDYGSDLAIVDERTGFLDLTFQLAWEMGKISAMSDRSIAAALMRLKKDIHNQTLEDAKKTLDATFVPATTALSAFQSTHDTLAARLDPNNVPGNQIIAQRWATTPLGESTRVILSFQSPAVQAQYSSQLSDGIGIFALAASSSQLSATPNTSLPAASSTSPGPYNETQSPLSTDYATLFAWIMDRWFLQGIPFANLIPDPSYIPKESIRCFYVDQSWYKAFVDGALSITEHYGEGDDVRESIKASLTAYLTTPLQATGFVPQIPKWGFFMRSECVTKFPDMRISAPWKDKTKIGKQAEVLRMLTLDTDLLCALFDREPGDFDPDQGIVLKPPEHQLTSIFGKETGIDPNGILNVSWKSVFGDLTKGLDPGSYTHPFNPFPVNVTGLDNGVYDSSCQALCPAYFAQEAHNAMAWTGNPATNVPAATPALVGTQLTVTVPKLNLLNNTSSGLQLTTASGSSLSTSKQRPGLPQRIPPSGPLKTPPPLQDLPAVPLPNYPLPINPILAAIAKTDLQAIPDGPIFQFLWKSDPSVTLAPTPNRPVTEYDKPMLSTSMYNIMAQFVNPLLVRPPPFLTIAPLIAATPLNLGFKTDIHVSTVSCTTEEYDLTTTSIAFPVGPSDNPANFLAPFPVTPTPGPPNRNADGLYPAQPRSASVVLPKVRVVAPGRRWRVSTFYTPAVAPSTTSTFTVTITANRGDPYADSKTILQWWPWMDINTNRDLSVVLEDVQLNFSNPPGGKQLHSIAVAEEYIWWGWPYNDNVPTPTYTINGWADITVRAVDVTKPDLVFV